jgi:lysophospholipase L1-like esterase
MLVAEAILRLRPRSPLEEQGRQARRRSIWQASDDEVLIYEHRPDYQGRTESHGILRGTEASLDKTGFRVVVLGDSIAAALRLPPSSSFAARLEEELGIEVLNFAVNGYRTVQEARLLELRAARFSPDVIVLQYCLNDPGNSKTPTIWFRKRSRSRLVRALTDPRDSAYVPVFGPDYGTADYWFRLYDPESRSWRSVERAFEAVARIGREQDARCVLLLFPLLLDGWKRKTVQPFHDQVTHAARKAGMEVIDLLSLYESIPVEDLRRAPGDIYHPNARGHAIAAQALARHLRREVADAVGN